MKLKMFYLSDDRITDGTMLVAESEEEAIRQYGEMVSHDFIGFNAECEEQGDDEIVRLHEGDDPLESDDGPPEATTGHDTLYNRKYIQATVRQWLDWYESQEITFGIVYEVE